MKEHPLKFRAFDVYIPFKFFLNNDNVDFSRFLDYMTHKNLGEKYDWNNWEGGGAMYEKYNSTDLDDWFNQPDLPEYKTDETQWVLKFTVYAGRRD